MAVKRQNLQRAFVRQALDTIEHGFDPLDRNLIYHASLVGDLYEEFYRRFAQTVQVTPPKASSSSHGADSQEILLPQCTSRACFL